eukprot:gene11395-7900_t
MCSTGASDDLQPHTTPHPLSLVFFFSFLFVCLFGWLAIIIIIFFVLVLEMTAAFGATQERKDTHSAVLLCYTYLFTPPSREQGERAS